MLSELKFITSGGDVELLINCFIIYVHKITIRWTKKSSYKWYLPSVVKQNVRIMLQQSRSEIEQLELYITQKVDNRPLWAQFSHIMKWK